MGTLLISNRFFFFWQTQPLLEILCLFWEGRRRWEGRKPKHCFIHLFNYLGLPLPKAFGKAFALQPFGLGCSLLGFGFAQSFCWLALWERVLGCRQRQRVCCMGCRVCWMGCRVCLCCMSKKKEAVGDKKCTHQRSVMSKTDQGVVYNLRSYGFALVIKGSDLRCCRLKINCKEIYRNCVISTLYILFVDIFFISFLV